MKSFIYEFVTIFFLFKYKSTQGLRWDNSKKAVLSESRILLGSTKSGPVIDVYHGNEVVIVKNIPTYNYPITIYCFVTGYRNDSQLSYSFCTQRACRKVVDVEIFKGTSIEITVESSSKRKGIKLKTTLKLEGDSSEDIHCQVTDDKNHLYIRSASIQIRDVFYWNQNLVVNENNLKSIHSRIDKNHLPITFPCFNKPLTFSENRPKWISLENLNPIRWNVCPIKPKFESLRNMEKMSFTRFVKYSKDKWPVNLDEVLKPREIKDMNNWKYFIDRTGNLTIYDFDTSTFSYAIMCYKKKNSEIYPINTYITQYSGNDIKLGIKFDNYKDESKITLSAISPIYQNVSIAARTVLPSREEPNPVKISVKYYSSSLAKWKWFKNGIEINKNLFISLDKYSINFDREITVDMEGNYTLKITDAEDKLNFTVYVKVVDLPSLINTGCMPKIYYAWEKENIIFSCSYQFNPNSLKYQINQQVIQKNYSKGVDLFSKKHYPHLNNLRFEISPMPYKESSVVNTFYKVYSLNKLQDHTIMISIGNDYGMKVITTSIYVLPTVEYQIEKFPQEYNCLSYCYSKYKHDFFCRFKKDEFLNKDLQIYHYWIIKNEEMNLSQTSSHFLMPYFTIDPQTQDLKLHPIHSNDSNRDFEVKKLLMDNSFECRIKLVSNFDQKIIYDSRLDEKLKSKLISKITLDNKTTHIIFGITIGFLVLLFGIIVTFLAYRFHQNRGKTYKIEKIDIQLGINPENELDDLRIKEYQPWSEYADRMFLSCTDMNDDDFDGGAGVGSDGGPGDNSGFVSHENEYEEMNMKTL